MNYIQDMAFDIGSNLINHAFFQSGASADGERGTTFKLGDVVGGNTYESSVEIDGITMPVFLRSDVGQQVYNLGPGFVSVPGALGPDLPLPRAISARQLPAHLRRRVA